MQGRAESKVHRRAEEDDALALPDVRHGPPGDGVRGTRPRERAEAPQCSTSPAPSRAPAVHGVSPRTAPAVGAALLLVVELPDSSFGLPGGGIAVGTYTGASCALVWLCAVPLAGSALLYVSSGAEFWRGASPGGGPRFDGALVGSSITAIDEH